MKLKNILLLTILAASFTIGSCEKLYQPKQEDEIIEYQMNFREYKKDRYGNEYFHQEQTTKKSSNYQKI